MTQYLVQATDNLQVNTRIFGASLAWGKWLSSIQYVLQAPDLIQKAYDQSKGEPFSVPALSEYQVFVSSEKHIQEVNESSQDQLSLHEAMEDVRAILNSSCVARNRVKQRYTFYGFEHGSIDPHDSVPGRVLKFLLRTNIPELRPKIQQKIEQAFDISLSQGKSKDGWTEISILSLSETIGMRINCLVISGDALGMLYPYPEPTTLLTSLQRIIRSMWMLAYDIRMT
ncbi:cytochrome P450 protein [Rutstroemia sp. NJR-2017a BBW]|nr:cytochrome P450 protein [Rutstroemia sp. NJR-2017a BBW]